MTSAALVLLVALVVLAAIVGRLSDHGDDVRPGSPPPSPPTTSPAIVPRAAGELDTSLDLGRVTIV